MIFGAALGGNSVLELMLFIGFWGHDEPSGVPTDTVIGQSLSTNCDKEHGKNFQAIASIYNTWMQ